MGTQRFRKILVSVKFVSAILGPEMGAPILWTPEKMRSFCRKNHVRKIPLFWGGGGSADFIFMGARIFLKDFHLPLHSRSIFQEFGWSPRARFEVTGFSGWARRAQKHLVARRGFP